MMAKLEAEVRRERKRKLVRRRDVRSWMRGVGDVSMVLVGGFGLRFGWVKMSGEGRWFFLVSR